MFSEITQKHDRVLIVGGGESLRDFNFNLTRNLNAVIITVNNVIKYLPHVNYWITVDPIQKDGNPQRGMIEQRKGVQYFCCLPDLETIQNEGDRNYYRRAILPGVQYLQRILPEDDRYLLQEDKSKITTGDSIFGALGLAYHFEAKKIAMIGVDVYGFGHWYDSEPPYNAYSQDSSKWEAYRNNVKRIYSHSVDQFVDRGIQVYNGSEDSFVDCFPKMSPLEALSKLIE